MPGGKLLQPGACEYIRDEIDLSQSGQERADGRSKRRTHSVALCLDM